jgi:hypothetical protein
MCIHTATHEEAKVRVAAVLNPRREKSSSVLVLHAPCTIVYDIMCVHYNVYCNSLSASSTPARFDTFLMSSRLFASISNARFTQLRRCEMTQHVIVRTSFSCGVSPGDMNKKKKRLTPQWKNVRIVTCWVISSQRSCVSHALEIDTNGRAAIMVMSIINTDYSAHNWLIMQLM